MGSDKITLCHGSRGSWNAITVSVNAVSGHDGHSEDVIPAFTTVDNQGNVTNYPGKNLGTDFGGQSGGDVLGNGCAAPAPGPTTQLAHLTVIVKVVNNDGGTKQPSEFTVTASGNGRSVSFAGQDDPGWSYTGEPGAYTVTQSTDPAYTTSPASCSGTLAAGGDATCVITNDDLPKPQPIEPLPAPWEKPPVVTPLEPVPFPTKPVVPAPPQPAPAPVPPGKPVPPIAPAPPFATLAALTVTVKVVNDDGGTAVPSSFGVLITGVDVVNGNPNFPGSSSGTHRTVTPGAYAVQQSTLVGYSTSYSEGCRASVGPGGTAACAIVNNDVAPGRPNPPAPPQPPTPPQPPGAPGGETTTITVITVVRNAGGGSLTPANFVDLISGTPVLSGTPVFRGRGAPGVTRTVEPGSYGVFQNRRLNYTRTYTGACSGSIAAGEHRTCVVVNSKQRLPSGRQYDLAIAKTGPRVVAPGGLATWRIVVSNLGPASAPGVAVADRLPAGFRFVRGGRATRLLAGFRFVDAAAATCRARATIATCTLGTLRSGDRRTFYVTARAPRTQGRASTIAAVLGTSFETKYRNNLARLTVRIGGCPAGTRSHQGACHPIVAGRG